MNNNTQSIADYLAQLLKDKKQLAAFPNIFLHVERLLDDGKNVREIADSGAGRLLEDLSRRKKRKPLAGESGGRGKRRRRKRGYFWRPKTFRRRTSLLLRSSARTDKFVSSLLAEFSGGKSQSMRA